jgi:hypothetical protein
MTVLPTPISLATVLQWLARQALKGGWKTGRWLAWIFLPAWLLVVALGAMAEWLEHL